MTTADFKNLEAFISLGAKAMAQNKGVKESAQIFITADKLLADLSKECVFEDPKAVAAPEPEDTKEVAEEELE